MPSETLQLQFPEMDIKHALPLPHAVTLMDGHHALLRPHRGSKDAKIFLHMRNAAHGDNVQEMQLKHGALLQSSTIICPGIALTLRCSPGSGLGALTFSASV